MKLPKNLSYLYYFVMHDLLLGAFFVMLLVNLIRVCFSKSQPPPNFTTVAFILIAAPFFILRILTFIRAYRTSKLARYWKTWKAQAFIFWGSLLLIHLFEFDEILSWETGVFIFVVYVLFAFSVIHGEKMQSLSDVGDNKH